VKVSSQQHQANGRGISAREGPCDGSNMEDARLWDPFIESFNASFDLNEVSSSAYSCAHVNLCLFPILCFVALWSIQSIFHDFCVPWCGRRVRVALTKHGLESWLIVIMRRKNTLCASVLSSNRFIAAFNVSCSSWCWINCLKC
jgi:hypothetical protein